MYITCLSLFQSPRIHGYYKICLICSLWFLEYYTRPLCSYLHYYGNYYKSIAIIDYRIECAS